MQSFTYEAKQRIDKVTMQAAEALAELCSKIDGVLTPIQWNHDLNTNQEMDSWFLTWAKDEARGQEILVGFLSVFAPFGDQGEFSGCVHPDYRRKGIYSKLNAMASAVAIENGITSHLHMVERASKSGQAFVATLTDELDHTEYAMEFDKDATLPQVLEMEVRKAEPMDFDRYTEVAASAFEMDSDRCRHFLEVSYASEHRTPYVGIVNDRIVAVSTLSLDNESICINGVGVSQEDQGKGYGKALMTGLLRLLVPEERTIVLDVDSTNAAAYPLYKGLGFKETQIVDYWAVKHR